MSETQTYPNAAYPGYPPPEGQQPMYPQQPQPGMPQPGMPQPGYPAGQPGYPMAQPGYPQPGAPQPGYPQPGAAQEGWMAKPEVVGCPPGLEYLTQIDQLLVHQTMELLEAFTNIETQNKYVIKNSAGQQVYYASEDSGFCMRQCCGARRGFTIHIADNFGKEVMRISRDFKFCGGCCWCACVDCCAFEVVVEAPVGTPVGYVRQSCSLWRPKFEIFDADHQPLMHLTGPWCICECPCIDVDFNLYSNDGEEVGKVNKQWSGLLKEMFVDSDNFGISSCKLGLLSLMLLRQTDPKPPTDKVPMDLDVKAKATCIGAVFLIDFMFFEKSGNKNNNN